MAAPSQLLRRVPNRLARLVRARFDRALADVCQGRARVVQRPKPAQERQQPIGRGAVGRPVLGGALFCLRTQRAHGVVGHLGRGREAEEAGAEILFLVDVGLDHGFALQADGAQHGRDRGEQRDQRARRRRACLLAQEVQVRQGRLVQVQAREQRLGQRPAVEPRDQAH